MKNMSTEEFCDQFDACIEGRIFAEKYKTMRTCYAAQLAGRAGEYSFDWALWISSCYGVMPDNIIRLFAVKCVRRLRHLLKDERCGELLDAMEKYAGGELSKEEGESLIVAADDVVQCAKPRKADPEEEASYWAARALYQIMTYFPEKAADFAAEAVKCHQWGAVNNEQAAERARAAYQTERTEQLRILAEFGNPFGKEHK